MARPTTNPIKPLTNSVPDFEQSWQVYQDRVQARLHQWLPAQTEPPQRLHLAMRYACLNGGKRLRAILVYACGQRFGANPDVLDVPACAVECMHAYSLVHDDMPAMDDDRLRRGRPTVHIEFDEGVALLAGDALQAFAFELLSNPLPPLNPDTQRNKTGHPLDKLDTYQQLQLVSLLSKASGSHGMAGGQGIDLESVGKSLDMESLEIMHRKKTGALIRASALMGAACGEGVTSKQMAELDDFADHLGLLFQITDDILDVTSTDQQLGKTAGKDMADDKPTYISVLALEGAQDQAALHHAGAAKSLEKLGGDTAFLEQLNDFVLNRTS